MMETRTRGKGTIDCRLRGSVGTLDDMNPTRLSKQSQGCPLTLTSPPVALVAKPRFKPKNTLSWNATGMTSLCDHATLSSIASSTFLQTTLKHLALIMDKVPS